MLLPSDEVYVLKIYNIIIGDTISNATYPGI